MGSAQESDPTADLYPAKKNETYKLDRPITPMTLLGVEFELPGPHTVRGKGAVVRCERISPGVEHYEVAVFLHDLAEGDREAIDDLVRRALEGQL